VGIIDGLCESVKFDMIFRYSDGLGESVKLLGRYSDVHFEPLMKSYRARSMPCEGIAIHTDNSIDKIYCSCVPKSINHFPCLNYLLLSNTDKIVESI